MYRKRRNSKLPKRHSAKSGKSGFTLVELSVVLALLAILTTMIISFSVLMNGFAAESRAEYEFLEDHDMLKEAVCTWAAENDVAGCIFKVNGDGTLTVINDGVESCVSFKGGILGLGDEQKAGLDAIDGVTFSACDKLVKCVSYRITKDGEQIESSFVFSLRCAVIDTGEVSQND